MSFIASSMRVTEIGGVQYVRADKHRDLDEDITLEDYGCGNGGYIHSYNEWDWFLTMDFKHTNHGLWCSCYWCCKYYRVIRVLARRWLDTMAAVTIDDRSAWRSNTPEAKELSPKEAKKQDDLAELIALDTTLLQV